MPKYKYRGCMCQVRSDIIQLVLNLQSERLFCKTGFCHMWFSIAVFACCPEIYGWIIWNCLFITKLSSEALRKYGMLRIIRNFPSAKPGNKSNRIRWNKIAGIRWNRGLDFIELSSFMQECKPAGIDEIVWHSLADQTRRQQYCAYGFLPISCR